MCSYKNVNDFRIIKWECNNYIKECEKEMNVSINIMLRSKEIRDKH